MEVPVPDREEEESSGNGLYCFLDMTRECGPDCMAYTITGGESNVLSTQQKNCTLLIAAERLGRYVGSAASTLNKMQQRAAADSADRARQPMPIPDPMGRK